MSQYTKYLLSLSVGELRREWRGWARRSGLTVRHFRLEFDVVWQDVSPYYLHSSLQDKIVAMVELASDLVIGWEAYENHKDVL